MPKRTCPFPEAFSSQYKIHIGQREINNYGVFRNKYRQEIYEKTKNLLFNGAKAVVGKIWTGDEKCPDSQSNEQHTACSQILLRGQTLIGLDGKLTRTNAVQGCLRKCQTDWSFPPVAWCRGLQPSLPHLSLCTVIQVAEGMRLYIPLAFKKDK